MAQAFEDGLRSELLQVIVPAANVIGDESAHLGRDHEVGCRCGHETAVG
jgi:hypothetical protein